MVVWFKSNFIYLGLAKCGCAISATPGNRLIESDAAL